ncbi:hypothetical protein NL676_028340 [Syzygium grande]|nr:hypothetical protein NL676_028340 [Syzygium grande]
MPESYKNPPLICLASLPLEGTLRDLLSHMYINMLTLLLVFSLSLLHQSDSRWTLPGREGDLRWLGGPAVPRAHQGGGAHAQDPEHVNSCSLRVGRRFLALNTDEDLEMANVYVMFPMMRLNSPVTATDMGALFLAASSAAKEGGGGGGGEAATAAAAVPELNPEEIEGFSSLPCRSDSIHALNNITQA